MESIATNDDDRKWKLIKSKEKKMFKIPDRRRAKENSQITIFETYFWFFI